MGLFTDRRRGRREYVSTGWKSRKGMQVRLGTQNTKEKLITELMKKVYREFKCPVFCTGLALLISIPSKTKRHTSGALQREGIDTQWCGAYTAQ